MPSAYNTSEESAAGSGVGTDPQTRQSDWEMEEMSMNPERTTYQDGFYYEPLSDEIKERITGISYPESGCTVPYEDLHYVRLLYVDFNGETQTGELICNKAIAQDMVEIFYELYLNDYRIERIRLIDEYGGDDTLSMEDNNTSCFNYRVVDGTDSLSKHALGCAIDINPFYNPYVVFNRPTQGETYISPKGSEIYADRSRSFPYKIDENDLCYRLFTAHGFTWGGNWNSSKDYQHFQIVL
ncbi:MAG: M15 family metallopeptidase [Lachnospiraceae bacterium]|nr:M15 family metallopeptidase [Lachnospiraceae bacterium]